MTTLRPRPAALAALALTLTAAACSEGGRDDDDDGGSGGGGGGGLGPAGAVNMEVFESSGQSCPAGNVHIDIGNVKTAPPTTVRDGQDGARVSCAVVPSGGKLEASGSLELGALSFSFGGLVTAGESAIGTAGFHDPASGAAYSSPASSPCVFQFAPGTDQGIAAGRLSVQFDCSTLVNEQDPAAACAARYGYLLVEGCEGGSP